MASFAEWPFTYPVRHMKFQRRRSLVDPVLESLVFLRIELTCL